MPRDYVGPRDSAIERVHSQGWKSLVAAQRCLEHSSCGEFYGNRKRKGVHGRLGVMKEPKDGRIETQQKRRYEMASVAGYFGGQPRRYDESERSLDSW